MNIEEIKARDYGFYKFLVVKDELRFVEYDAASLTPQPDAVSLLSEDEELTDVSDGGMIAFINGELVLASDEATTAKANVSMNAIRKIEHAFGQKVNIDRNRFKEL